MNAATIGKFLTVTIGLTIGLAVTMAAAYRANIAANWEANKCDPGVIPIAGAFKPASDPRTAGEFAEANWRECQKEYIQRAVAVAAEAPKELVAAQADVVAMADDAASLLTDVFVDVWNVCYEAYSTFMDRMKGAAKLFQNTLVQIHNVIGRMQAALLTIVYALISTILAFVDSVKIVLIVAIIVIGILVALQVILFFLFLPISGLIITMTFVLSLVIVAVATAVAAAMVSELFAPGACFKPGTLVAMADGTSRPIESLHVGEELLGDRHVVAVHRFLNNDPVYNLWGIQVTGDHLVPAGSAGELLPVAEHPEARLVPRTLLELLQVGGMATGRNEVWCLTTSDRRIPCIDGAGGVREFADWEEIPDSARDRLAAWRRAVYAMLNGGDCGTISDSALESEAALHLDTEVGVRDPRTGVLSWMRVADVPLGAQVACGSGSNPEEWTTVVGRVEIEGDAVDRVVLVGPNVVSEGCWLREHDGLWTQLAAEGAARYPATTASVASWIHLYTASGTILLRGGYLVRDASDVGLDRIGAVNDAVVLGRGTDKN
jgi:hypothetical protein